MDEDDRNSITRDRSWSLGCRCSTAQLNVGSPHTDAIEAEAGRDDLEPRIGAVQQASELTFGARVWPAQDREAPAVAAGPVHLPARCATRRGDFDCSLGVCAHEAGVKLALRLSVVDHGSSERAEVRLAEGIARSFGSMAQLVERGSLRALLSQTGDDAIVKSR